MAEGDKATSEYGPAVWKKERKEGNAADPAQSESGNGKGVPFKEESWERVPFNDALIVPAPVNFGLPTKGQSHIRQTSDGRQEREPQRVPDPKRHVVFLAGSGHRASLLLLGQDQMPLINSIL